MSDSFIKLNYLCKVILKPLICNYLFCEQHIQYIEQRLSIWGPKNSRCLSGKKSRIGQNAHWKIMASNMRLQRLAIFTAAWIPELYIYLFSPLGFKQFFSIDNSGSSCKPWNQTNQLYITKFGSKINFLKSPKLQYTICNMQCTI